MSDSIGSIANPTAEDQRQFLLRLYFGRESDPLLSCVNRAYLDFNRTLHGIGRSNVFYSEMASFLRGEVEELKGAGTSVNQSGFDARHKHTCLSLCKRYKDKGFAEFHIGQSQKWINMTMKYIYVVGEESLPGYADLYSYCHVPIDNILLQVEEFAPLRNFKEAWSRINDYETYMEFQRAVRERYKCSSPLAIEFVAWQRENAAQPFAQPDPTQRAGIWASISC